MGIDAKHPGVIAAFLGNKCRKVERGHVSRNPLYLIKHPKFEERVIPTVGEKELLALLELVNPKHAHTEAEKFRTYRNRAIVS